MNETSKRSAVISGQKLMNALAPVLDLSPKARRVIIDMQVGQPVKIYVEQFGDERLLSFDWPDMREAVITLKDASL